MLQWYLQDNVFSATNKLYQLLPLDSPPIIAAPPSAHFSPLCRISSRHTTVISFRHFPEWILFSHPPKSVQTINFFFGLYANRSDGWQLVGKCSNIFKFFDLGEFDTVIGGTAEPDRNSERRNPLGALVSIKPGPHIILRTTKSADSLRLVDARAGVGGPGVADE